LSRGTSRWEKEQREAVPPKPFGGGPNQAYLDNLCAAIGMMREGASAKDLAGKFSGVVLREAQKAVQPRRPRPTHGAPGSPSPPRAVWR